MKYFCLLLFLLLAFSFAYSQKEVPFTLDDRDRLIRLEEELSHIQSNFNTGLEAINTRLEATSTRIDATNERINSLEKQMNNKFESVETRFTFLYWALSLLIGLVIINLGYTIWDRRTAIHPIKEKLKDLEKDKNEMDKKMVEVEKIKAALKEMGESDEKIAEILKKVAIF